MNKGKEELIASNVVPDNIFSPQELQTVITLDPVIPGKKPPKERNNSSRFIYESNEYEDVPQPKRTPINHILIIGDSLTDRGSFAHRTLLGLPIMGKLAGLTGRTPFGRFTNGYTWSDHLAWDLAQISFTRELLKKNKEYKEKTILEELKTGEWNTLKQLIKNEMGCNADKEEDYKTWWQERVLEIIAPLNDDTKVSMNGTAFYRTYAEGGLMASPHMEFILSNLDEQFQKIKNDDRKMAVTSEEKAKTLVMEWSGANDLVTATAVPEYENAYKAIEAKRANILKLIEQGYTNIVVCNLPDLSLTPRFQNTKNAGERAQAREVTMEFNAKLELLVQNIGKEKGINIQVVDAYSEFNEYYVNPEEHGFSREKRNQTYSDSKYYKKPDGTNVIPDSHEFMFDDDLHPSNRFHELLANKICMMLLNPANHTLKSQFDFSPPSKNRPVMGYRELFEQYRKDNPDEKDLATVSEDEDAKKQYLHGKLDQALYHGDCRIRQQLMDLRWINGYGKINPNYSRLVDLYRQPASNNQSGFQPESQNRTLAYTPMEYLFTVISMGFYSLFRYLLPELVKSPVVEDSVVKNESMQLSSLVEDTEEENTTSLQM